MHSAAFNRTVSTTILVLSLVLLTAAGCTSADITGRTFESEEHTFTVIEVAGGLDHPWSLVFLPDGSILVTERPGGLVLVRDGDKIEVSGAPQVAAAGQGGLLDAALHPDYERTGWIYLTYSKAVPAGSSQYATALGRARLSGTELVDLEELFVMNEPGSTTRHFGSRIVFGPDGYLYMTLGDRGERDRAQTLDDHGGSTLRLTDTGAPAPGNPFAGDPDALPEIYSYGHRNAQGMTLHPETGAVWQHEHGPLGGDEVNVIGAGNNYGWPVITYGREYSGDPVGEGITHHEGMEQPLAHWEPSIAPSGMTFYTGNEFPTWRGDLFLGALAGKHLRRLETSGETVVHQEVLLEGVLGRIRDVTQGPDGYLYLITDESSASVYRLEPAE